MPAHLELPVRKMLSLQSLLCLPHLLQQESSCLHNCLYPHGISLSWNIRRRSKKSFICLNSTLLKVHTMCPRLKCLSWLIKSNMSIMSHSKKLKIYASKASDQFLITLHHLFYCLVPFHWANVCVSPEYSPDEQMLMHKVIIALFIGSRQSFIFVQIDTCHL